ncbi:MAG TPA: SgcJ/EcaC family oxidoreductase [Gemmatimonadaceae bacterium]|nr:SgcJ/EcaC family oxidoreductase [Gemmatimonadaceae bacterium]
MARVVEAWDAAWNAANSDSIAATFVDSAEFINGRGQVAFGAAKIGAQHAVNLAGPFKGSHIEGTIRRITFLSGTTAILDVDSKLTGFAYLPPGTVPTLPGMQSGRHKRVLVKRGGAWKTVLMQITLIAPAQ